MAYRSRVRDKKTFIRFAEEGRAIDDDVPGLVVTGRPVRRHASDPGCRCAYSPVPEGGGDADICLAAMAQPRATTAGPMRFPPRRVSPALVQETVRVEDAVSPSAAPEDVVSGNCVPLQTPRRSTPPSKFCTPEARPEMATTRNQSVYHPIKQLKKIRAEGAVEGDVAGEGSEEGEG